MDTRSKRSLSEVFEGAGNGEEGMTDVHGEDDVTITGDLVKVR